MSRDGSMKVAIVGSREYPHLHTVAALVRDFYGWTGVDVEIVSGGARGVDRTAVATAKSLGLPWKEFLPDWKKNGKAAGVIRNQEIAEYADCMYAFWDMRSRGTADAIRRMRELEKPVTIIRSGRAPIIP